MQTSFHVHSATCGCNPDNPAFESGRSGESDTRPRVVIVGAGFGGLSAAKAIALARALPLIAVNHLEGHALSPRLVDADLAFPYLLLLVSGGHCQFVFVEGVGRYRRLGSTIDDAGDSASTRTSSELMRLSAPKVRTAYEPLRGSPLPLKSWGPEMPS